VLAFKIQSKENNFLAKFQIKFLLYFALFDAGGHLQIRVINEGSAASNGSFTLRVEKQACVLRYIIHNKFWPS
jgi:hypothetical protein